MALIFSPTFLLPNPLEPTRDFETRTRFQGPDTSCEMEAIGSVPARFRPAQRARYSPHRRIPAAAAAVRSETRGDRMFVFGLGFVGRYVSDLLKKEGWQVSGTCTSAVKKKVLEQMGLDAFIFDVNESKLRELPTLQHATHLLISIPPVVGIGDPLLSLHEDLQTTLSCGNLRWLCYLSSTSVYGDCGGAWVNEGYPANPKRESAKARFAAETEWLDLGRELGVSAYVLRLGGIYGPGRSALDTIIKQRPMSKEQRMRNARLYTARVHVADIYQAIKASFNIPSSGTICNVVDDEPAPRAEVFSFAEALLRTKWPDMINQTDDGELQIQQERDSSIRGVGVKDGEKRVSNARLKNELGVELLYPNYRCGLQSILDSWGGTPSSSLPFDTNKP